MSRIDEALKRAASVHTVAEHRASSAVTLEETTLEQYPREGREAVSDRTSPASDRQHLEVTYAHELPHARVIAAPRTGDKGQLGQLGTHLEGKLVVGHETESVPVEQYRRLAATMHELQSEQGLKALMVCSALPGEGKTLTVTNLALTLSESYKRRVLLIDADLRRPSLHEVFRVPNRSGLSEGLRSDRGDLSLLKISPYLNLLPAGQADSNPMAALTSDRMRRLLEESTNAFDWVLLDAPPVGLMPDANLLARLTKAVLFVIGAGSTPFSLVRRAIEDVGRECIVGTVLNRVESQVLPSADYYRDYHDSGERA